MRKQELVHLHALSVRVRCYVEDRHDISADAFARYDRTCVGPTAIHRGKGDHADALLELFAVLATLLDADGVASSISTR